MMARSGAARCQELQQWDVGRATKTYSSGGQRVAMRQNGVLYYLLGDHLGSTSVSYNTSTGAVSAQRYTPYGAPRGPASTLPTDYKFTGQRAEMGLGSLYDYNARHYSPTLGRFLSPDAIVPAPGNPQSLNRYAYVLNNPLRYTDPTGHWVESAFDVISLGLTINDIRNEGFTLGNTVALITDAASVALPIVPAGVSHALRAWKLANKAVNVVDTATDAAKVISKADEAVDAVKAISKVGKEVPNASPQSFSRFVSKGELDAISDTGLLRGGREGDTFFTTNKYRTAESAQNKLSLPNSPEYRIDFKITNNPQINGPRIVEPQFTNYKGYPNIGGGIEYWTPDKVRINVYRVRRLE